MSRKARLEVAREEVTLGHRTVPYVIVRSDRARNVRLRITPHGIVEIVVPRRARLPDVGATLAAHSRWILRHLDRLGAERVAEGGRLPYLGEEYPLVVDGANGRRALVRLATDGLRVSLPPDGNLKAVLEGWYRMQAAGILEERVKRWSTEMAIPYRRVTIRDQRTRWGSCSALGNLNFSWRLVAAPLPVLDYVVIHELMHVREMHHGPAFWAGVERYCPEHESHRAWLREHGRRLSRVLEAEPGDGSPGGALEP